MRCATHWAIPKPLPQLSDPNIEKSMSVSHSTDQGLGKATGVEPAHAENSPMSIHAILPANGYTSLSRSSDGQAAHRAHRCLDGGY
eukprot:361840-Chlamydomonas_euryale.AAC.6